MTLRLCIAFLFGYALLSSPGSASTIIYGAGNTPDTNSNTACSPTCPELTSGPGLGLFNLASTSTLQGITFWTLESQDTYQGGMLTWSIYTDINDAPGALLGSGQFSLSPRNFIQTVSVAGLPLNLYQNDFALTTPLTLTLSSGPQNFFLNLQDTSGVDAFGIFWATSTPSSLAFQITGTGNDLAIPEPASLSLAAIALLGIAALHKSNRSAS